ncbi:MAG: ribonuclease HII [Pseudomonadota bacterium]|nr:ribonuclease HII [Pseudomonadota bacterium]
MKPQVAGVDEAGRGPLAGPVVAAAVILRPGGRPIPGVADSKQLTAKVRLHLSVAIRRRALCFGIGWADPAEIDSLNILHATFLAMRRAILSMHRCPDELLVDGNRLPRLTGLGTVRCARAIIGGDVTETAISAASILAKAARDHYMNQMDAVYPGYAFSSHKGYATELHRRLLAQHGPCPIHRRSFAPVGAHYVTDDEWEADALASAAELDAMLEV